MRPHSFERAPPPMTDRLSIGPPPASSASQAVGEGERDAFERGPAEIGARRRAVEAEDARLRRSDCCAASARPKIGQKDEPALRRRRDAGGLDLGEQARLRRRRRKDASPKASALAADRITAIRCHRSGRQWQKACIARSGSGLQRRIRDEDDARGPERKKAPARVARRRCRRRRRRCRRRRPATGFRGAVRALRRRSRQGAGRIRRCPRRGAACARSSSPVAASIAATSPAAPTSSHKRARSVGRLADGFAGQLQPQPVLRQQHARGAGEQVGLVLGDPHQLRRGETGHREVAGDVGGCPVRGARARARARGAAVVPQDRRTQHRIVRVEQHGAVHLPGQADPRATASSRLPDDSARTAVLCRAPPIVGVLLGPQRARAGQRERRRSLADEGAILVDEDRLDARRAEIDAEIHPPRALSGSAVQIALQRCAACRRARGARARPRTACEKPGARQASPKMSRKPRNTARIVFRSQAQRR